MSIEFETRGNIAIITLNRPEAKNAINGASATGIEAALDQYEADDSLWCALLTGSGDVFCAGADLKEISAGKAADLSTPKGGFAGMVMRQRTKPLIAAINGPALAGGCELALACDLRVASDQAFFGLPEVKRSLVAAAGGLFRLPRVLGMTAAMEAVLTGDPITAERCHTLGMLNRVVPKDQVLSTALELAERIVKNAPLAVFASRAIVAESFNKNDEALWNDSFKAFGDMMKTEDFKEGPRAFIEKRDPVWQAK